MNLVVLKGNVGQDPRITTFEEGGKVAQFTLATTERGYKTKDGKEIPEQTEWHSVVVKRTGLADVCEKYVKKGSPLLIEGRLKTREYTGSDGIKRYITEVIVDELELLGSKEKREDPPAPAPDTYEPLFNDLP